MQASKMERSFFKCGRTRNGEKEGMPQGKAPKAEGTETASDHRLPIPKRLCGYTQTIVRLYPND